MAKMMILVLVVIGSIGLDTGFASVNPGLQFRLSQAGLNYGANVALEVLKNSAMKLRIPDQRGSTRIPLGRVKYEVTNMQITQFDKPHSDVVINPGSGLTWRLTNVRLVIRGRWRYRLPFIRDSGTFDMIVSARNFLEVSVSLGKDPSGRFTISSRRCSCIIDKVKIRFHGGASWLYNLFASKIEHPIRNAIRQRICVEANKVINVKARAQLATLPFTIDILKHWTLDYRLVSPPIFKTGFIESHHKGEFFLKNNTKEAPFQASPFPASTVAGRMVTVWISDYMLNTIGYVLYNGGILKRHLTKDQLPRDQRGLFNTTCTSIQCFGVLIPSAGKVYPNATAEFEVVATSSPTATVTTAGVQGNFNGTVTCRARLSNGSLVPMFKANISAVSHLKESLSGMVLRCNITRLSTVIKITESHIGKLSGELLTTLFNIAAKVVILPELNAVGQKGIPIPGFKNVQFVNTVLDNLDHCVRVATDARYVA